MSERRKTREISLGMVRIGGGAPVTVQSMTNTDTSDAGSTMEQIRELEAAGCDIVRVAVPDIPSAEALPMIVKETSVPVVADVHFDRHQLAMLAMESGVAGIRINPGTIGNRSRLADIAREAADKNIAVRVGINAGSLERRLLGPGGHAEASALAVSALEGASYMEEHGVKNIKISVKASDVPRTIEAYRIVSGECDWPLHVGVTEAGTTWSGTIKSSIGIGALLAEGIGDTIRVSLTASPVEEVRVGRKILAALGLGSAGPEVISCPTCARAEIDVIKTALELERRISALKSNIKVAVMGCAVNGPGEVRDADIGIAGSRTSALLFVKGEMIKKVEPENILDEIIGEIERMTGEKTAGESS
ncbi:MAG: flavodoxin-dependent (E)-4-hydroxy-3-methylbut-2-enyl-diphosphate synthase [Actinobacteria bacterium]|nr:flavodoxin-dependent (E)-4-hydroxy-3-methylbut-2-enyl-diphosphate synthase [Actinomycetota bacterium]